MLHKLLSMGAFRQYNVALAKETSVNASILLAYLLYQQEQFGGGEFYNTAEKITQYTGLSRKEIETATTKLIEAKLIKRKVKGSPPVAHFNFDEECHHNLNQILLDHFYPTDSENTEDGGNQFPEMDKSISQNGQIDFPKWTNTPIYKNIDNKSIEEDNIKLHSPSFSDENNPGVKEQKLAGKEIKQPGKESPLPPLQPETQDKPKKPEPHEKYKITADEYKTLQSYFKGFCEAIDRVAKVKYSKDFKIIAGIYKKINKDMGVLKSIYSYFCTYRDFDSQYSLEIRSLNSLSEKFERLIDETRRETFRKIQESGSVILHIDSERRFFIQYPYHGINQKDLQKITGLKQNGYRPVLMDSEAIPVNLIEAGYHKNEDKDNGKSHYSHLNY